MSFTPYVSFASEDGYMCPFCISSSECRGPHVGKEELENYNYAMRDLYEQARQDAAEEVLRAPTKGGKGVWMLRANAVIAAEGKRKRGSS